MSKRYDEYINKVTNKMNNNFLTEVIPVSYTHLTLPTNREV